MQNFLFDLQTFIKQRLFHYFALIFLVLGLSACGGGSSSDSASGNQQNSASSSSSKDNTIQNENADLPPEIAAEVAAIHAEPAFHMLPLAFTNADLNQANASNTTDANSRSRRLEQEDNAQPIVIDAPDDLSKIPTQRLTAEEADAYLAQSQANSNATAAAPATKTSNTKAYQTRPQTVIYTPQAIRSAYNMTSLARLNELRAIYGLGAGQTIYIITAYHHPNAFSDFLGFSQTFGLPLCTNLPIQSATSLPLSAAKPQELCTFSTVYASPSGNIVDQAPAYNSRWASETALDSQWAHALAPAARVVVIEAQDNSISSLLGAIRLANRMGPGVVSMSFVAPEGSFVSGIDHYFSEPNMTYLAATGDSGTQANWPAVSSKVIAVGGTTLNINPAAPSVRSEILWSNSGGALSQYVSKPDYQNSVSFPQASNPAKRGVGDVSFNANPNTGQYVLFTPQNASSVWRVFGGTSISTPQWAGILTVSNAQRASVGKSLLGNRAHHALYYVAQISYNSTFFDITQGSNGSCVVCSATSGYDVPSGLGTPKITMLLQQFNGY